MRTRILVVDDDGNIYNLINEAFDDDFELIRARSVDEAVGEFRYNGTFDCFIIDLQIIASGLTEEEMVYFQKREGYALFKNYLCREMNNEQIMQMKTRTIICSRYINDFVKEYSKEELNGLTLVIKKIGMVNEIRKEVNRIIKTNNINE